MRFKLAVAVLLLCVSSAFGQSATDMEIKYGKPLEVYSLSEHIWMTPEFGADGQVCQMRLYPKRIDLDINYLSPTLPFEELQKVLNQLVPVDIRGKKEPSFGLTDTGRPAAWTTYGYENVTFTFLFSFSPPPFVNSPPKGSGYDFPIRRKGEETKSSAPSSDDFGNSRSSSIEIVTIKWNNRKCGGN